MQIGGNLQVDALHLAGQGLESGIELARKHPDIFRVDGFTDVIAAGKLDKLAITLHQRLHQLGVGQFDLGHLPLAAVIQMTQDIVAPAPLPDQTGDHIPPPLTMAGLAIPTQIVTHLEIETAARQIQTLAIANLLQIARHLIQHQVVGVEPQAVLLMLLEPLPTLDREQVGLRKLGRVSLHQQDLEHRLVG